VRPTRFDIRSPGLFPDRSSDFAGSGCGPDGSVIQSRHRLVKSIHLTILSCLFAIVYAELFAQYMNLESAAE
jgi:hypothetical protein